MCLLVVHKVLKRLLDGYVWFGGHFFPAYVRGIDPIAHAEAPASPGSAAIPRHLPPSLTTPFVAPPIHHHHLLLTPTASHHPTGVLPERRCPQATTGAPSVMCRKLPPELSLPLVTGRRRDPLCHGYRPPLRRGRRLTPGPLCRGSRLLTGLSPLRSQSATEAPTAVRSPPPKLLSAPVARAPWIAAPEVEESPSRWVPIGCSLMIGVLSWASTLHARLTRWRSWAVCLCTGLACYSWWSRAIH